MVVAGTAHRPKGLTTKHSPAQTNVLVNALADFFLHYLRRIKPERVLAGGALGGDTGLAIAALRYGVPLTVAIPFYEQEAKWGKQAQGLYYRILDRAKDVVYVEQGAYAAWKMQSRNEWMVSKADLVLALFSGAPGGTANCVDYASRAGVPVWNLWDEWVNFRVHHKL
jgi:uncharacterized phage-like protein YoqJ